MGDVSAALTAVGEAAPSTDESEKLTDEGENPLGLDVKGMWKSKQMFKISA